MVSQVVSYVANWIANKLGRFHECSTGSSRSSARKHSREVKLVGVAEDWLPFSPEVGFVLAEEVIAANAPSELKALGSSRSLA